MKTWLTSLLLIAIPTLTFSQDTTRLRTIEVSATRIPIALKDAARHIQVLDSNTLRLAQAPQISELLRLNTSLDVRQRGPFDIQTDIGIRGGTFDQALVLVNGIPMNDAQTGHHTMNTGLTGNALSQIDVLYGAAARTFGAGAFSGAVNLRLREPEADTGFVSLQTGWFNDNGNMTLSGQGGISFVDGDKGLRLNGSLRNSDGYFDNTDNQSGSINGTLKWPVGKSKLLVHGLYDHKQFGALNYYTSAFPNQFEETRMLMGAAELSGKGKVDWSVKAYARQHHDRFELFREDEDYYVYNDGVFVNNGDTAPSWYGFHNVHRTRTYGGILDLKKTWFAGTTQIGVQFRNVELLSNALGEFMDEPIAARNERELYTRSDGRTNMAIHFDHRKPCGNLLMDLGVLVNLNSDYATELLPGLDLLYKWNERHRSFAGGSQGFRLPTFTDLYYSRGGAQGSIDLKPEHNTQFEIGHRFSTQKSQWTLTAFRRIGDDLIDWVLLPGDSIVRASNLTELTLSGIELSANTIIIDDLLRAGLSYAYIQSDREEFEFTSLYVLDQLRHRLAAWATVEHGRFRLRANAAWQERAGTFREFTTGIESEYPSPVRIDARIDVRLNSAALFFKGYNLTNAEQMDRPNVFLPGRWVGFGLRLDF